MNDLLETIKDINRVYVAGMAAQREVDSLHGAPMTDLTLDPRNVIRRSREVIDQTLDQNLRLNSRVLDLESVLEDIRATSSDQRVIARAAAALERK